MGTSHHVGNASEALLHEAYTQLRAVAARYLSRGGAVTLQPTALVHEAWMKLANGDFKDREHFCAVAARAMRQILVDRVKARNRAKRGGGWERVTLSGVSANSPLLEVLELDAALTELAALSPREAKIVELRVFGGLSVEEVAHVLETSLSTIEKDWRRARAWLMGRLKS